MTKPQPQPKPRAGRRTPQQVAATRVEEAIRAERYATRQLHTAAGQLADQLDTVAALQARITYLRDVVHLTAAHPDLDGATPDAITTWTPDPTDLAPIHLTNVDAITTPTTPPPTD